MRENGPPFPLLHDLEGSAALFTMFKQPPQQPAIARRLRHGDTRAEQILWRWLRDRRFSAYKSRRQHPQGQHILDFYCVEAKLNIELDGFQHGHPERREADAARDTWLAGRGIMVLRFWNARLRREKEVVRNAIWEALQDRAPRPVPEYCRPGIVRGQSPNRQEPSA